MIKLFALTSSAKLNVCAHAHTQSPPPDLHTLGRGHPSGGIGSTSEFRKVYTPNLFPACLPLRCEASWALRRERGAVSGRNGALSALFLRDPHGPHAKEAQRAWMGVCWLSDVRLLGGEALFFRQESGALFRSLFISSALKFQFCLDRLPMHKLGQAVSVQSLFADAGVLKHISEENQSTLLIKYS